MGWSSDSAQRFRLLGEWMRFADTGYEVLVRSFCRRTRILPLSVNLIDLRLGEPGPAQIVRLGSRTKGRLECVPGLLHLGARLRHIFHRKKNTCHALVNGGRPIHKSRVSRKDPQCQGGLIQRRTVIAAFREILRLDLMECAEGLVSRG